MYYKYSELYKQNSVDKQLKIEYDGGVITNNELYSESFELTESLCSENNLKFGTCEASVLKFKIANVVESLKGKWLTVTETLAGNESTPFQFGKYKVYSDVPSADRNYRDVTAYDSMYDILNADMTEWWNSTTGSATIRHLRISFLDYFGIECEDIELPNDCMIVQFFNIESLSGKDFINAICELNGCFGHIGRDGKFYFKLLTSSGGEVLYPTDGGQVAPPQYFDGNYLIIDNELYFKIWGDFLDTHKYASNFKYYTGLNELKIHKPFNMPASTVSYISFFADTAGANYDDYNYDDYLNIQVYGLVDGSVTSIYRLGRHTTYSNYRNCTYINKGGTFEMAQQHIMLKVSALPYVSGVPVFITKESMEYYMNTGDASGAINYFKGESKEETDNENSQIDVLYPSDSLYSVSSIVELQNRFFDGNYKIVDKYFYFRVYGQFITKGTTNVEEWHEGSYEARFRVPNGCERACIRWKSGFYTTYNDETYYSPEFHWVDTYGERQVDNDVYPEIDFNGDGTFESQKTIYVRVDDFKYMSGVPVFEIDQELYSYLSGEDTTHYINWNGINEIEKSRCISGKYEDYTVRKIDCVQIKNEENDIGAVAGDGENPYIIEDCFLCYGKSSADLQPIVNNIYNTIKDITYLPYEAEVLGNPCLEVADRVSIKARNKTIDSYILKRTIRGIQGLRDTYSATGEEIQNKKVNSVSKSIIQLKKQTNTLTRTVDETISEIYSTDESGERVSRIQQNEEAIIAEVTRATGKETELSSKIEITEKSIESKVEKGEIISTINQTAEAVTINADKINLNGAVTANNNVTIDEDGKITAKEAIVNGTIEATILKADKDFYIVDSDFDNPVKVITFVSDETSDTVYRFGRLTDNTYGSGLNFIAFKDMSQDRSIVFNTGNVNFNGAGIASDLKISTFKLRGGDKDTDLMYCNTDKSAYFGPQSTLEGYTSYFRGETVRLVGANGVYLGSSGSTAVSSDENLKDLFEIDERYEQFFDLLEPVLYTYKETGHRKHVGIGARHVKDCLDKAGIDTEDFAGLIIETDVTIGEEENQQHYDELYSIRYEEFVMLNTMKIKKLEKRIEVLESEKIEQNELIRSLVERIEKLEGR